MIRIACLAAVLSLAAAPALAQSPADTSLILTYETGADAGKVMVALFDTEAAFGGGAPVRAGVATVSGGRAVVRFEDLPAGEYAAKAFHDLNGNDRMDTNPFGIPTEPYAFSNNAVGNMGPARWAQASFSVSGPTAQNIVIR